MSLSPYYVRDGQLRPLSSSFFGGPTTLYQDDFSNPARISEWNRGGESVDGTFEIAGGVLRYTVGPNDGARPRISRRIDVANGSWIRIIAPAAAGTSPRPEFYPSSDGDDWAARLIEVAVEESVNQLVQVPVDGFNAVWLVLRAGTDSVAGDTVEIDRLTVTLEQVADIPPTAVPDTVETTVNTDVDINVLANDIAGTNQIDPTSLQIVDQPNQGNAGVANGVVMYSPPTDYVGPADFTYDVADIVGLRSQKAACTVTVSALPPSGGMLGTTSYPAASSEVFVSNMGDAQSAANSAGPGTHVVFNSNTNGSMVVNSSGTASNPIIIRSDGTRRTVGRIRVNGDHVWIWGLRFTGDHPYGVEIGECDDGKIINNQFDQMGANNRWMACFMVSQVGECRRWEIGWNDFTSPVDFYTWNTGDPQWPQFRFGFRGRHDNGQRAYELRFHHCFFDDFPGIDEGTGVSQAEYRAAQSDCVEEAPIGSTDTSNNQYDHCLMRNIRSIHGSIMDMKGSRGGLVEFMTFLNCAGRFSLRTIDACTVRHIWCESIQGIAVYGSDHLFDDIFFTGSGSRRIELYIGNLPYGASPATDQRPACDDVVIQCCPTANIVLGARFSVSPPYPPRNTIIRGSYASLDNRGAGTQLVPGFACGGSQAIRLTPSQVGTEGLANL